MIIEDRPDLATKLLKDTNDRLRKQHVSGGNAITSVKKLTECIRAAWGEKHLGWVKPPIEDDEVALIRILLGVAMGDLFSPEVEERIEIKTKYGIVSGRIDIQQKDSGTIDLGNGDFITWENGETIPGEIKITWKSQRKGIADFVQYVNQILGYMCAKNSTKGRLIVEHVTSYEPGQPPLPKLRIFEITLTEEELEQIRLKIEEYTGMLMDPDNMPGTNLHPDGECSWCAFSVKNGGQCETGKGYSNYFVPLEKFIQ